MRDQSPIDGLNRCAYVVFTGVLGELMSDATFSVRLPDKLRQEVDDFAKATKRSRSFVVKEAVEAYMQDQREYQAAIEEGEREADLGVLVSGDAVKKWLLSWGTDNELPRPEPDIFPDGKP